MGADCCNADDDCCNADDSLCKIFLKFHASTGIGTQDLHLKAIYLTVKETLLQSGMFRLVLVSDILNFIDNLKLRHQH